MSSVDRVQFMAIRSARQQRPQAQPRFVYLRLRRALGYSQDLADFAMFEPLHVVQDERGAASFRQLRHRPLEIHLRHRRARRGDGWPHRAATARRQSRRSSESPVPCGCADSRGTGSRPADTARSRAPTRRGSSPACGAPRGRRPAACPRRRPGCPASGRGRRRASWNGPVHLLERPEIALAAALDQRKVVLPGRACGRPFMLDDTGSWRRCRHFPLFFAGFGHRRAESRESCRPRR